MGKPAATDRPCLPSLSHSFTLDGHWSLYDWVDMQEELKGICGRDVDLVEKKSLHNPFRRHAILTTKQVIYAA